MMIEMFNIDCMEYMAGLEDNSFDLAIVDPPYGINVNTAAMGKRKDRPAQGYKPFFGGDKSPPSPSYFKELKRVSNNQIIWGANHFLDEMSAPINTPCWLIWDKKYSPDLSFAQFESAWTSFDTVSKKFEFAREQIARIHPTQKPVKLYQWLLDNYAEPGQRILDTHLGSGSSAIAAHYFGVDFVGCELDQDYYEAACERFDHETKQQAMF